MPRLSLHLLGGFEVRTNSGRPIEIPPKKARALLTYLALGPRRGRQRAEAAALIWENSDNADARSSLRSALSAIRRAMPTSGKNAIMATTEWVGIREATVGIDVVTFERLLDSGTTDDRNRAIALYQGDLLNDFRIKAPAFNAWAEGERTRLRQRALKAMTAAVSEQLDASEVSPETVSVGTRLLALDPLRELSHRLMMQLYVRMDEPSSAIRQYLICRETLRLEGGLTPEPETQKLYQDIRDQTALFDG